MAPFDVSYGISFATQSGRGTLFLVRIGKVYPKAPQNCTASLAFIFGGIWDRKHHQPSKGPLPRTFSGWSPRPESQSNAQHQAVKNILPQKIWSYCKFDLVALQKKLPTTQLKTLFHTCSIFQAKKSDHEPWIIPSTDREPTRPPGTPNQGFVALLQRLHIRLSSAGSTRAMFLKQQWFLNLIQEITLKYFERFWRKTFVFFPKKYQKSVVVPCIPHQHTQVTRPSASCIRTSCQSLSIQRIRRAYPPWN